MNLQGLLDFASAKAPRATPIEGGESAVPVEDGGFELVWSGEQKPAPTPAQSPATDPAALREAAGLQILMILTQATESPPETALAPDAELLSEGPPMDAAPAAEAPPSVDPPAPDPGQLGVVAAPQPVVETRARPATGETDEMQPTPAASKAPAREKTSPAPQGPTADAPVASAPVPQQPPLAAAPAEAPMARPTTASPAAPSEAGSPSRSASAAPAPSAEAPQGLAAPPAPPPAAAKPPQPKLESTAQPLELGTPREAPPTPHPAQQAETAPEGPTASETPRPAKAAPASAAPQPQPQPLAAPPSPPPPAAAGEAPVAPQLGDGSPVQIRVLPTATPTVAPVAQSVPRAAPDELSPRFAPAPLSGWPEVAAREADATIPSEQPPEPTPARPEPGALRTEPPAPPPLTAVQGRTAESTTPPADDPTRAEDPATAPEAPQPAEAAEPTAATTPLARPEPETPEQTARAAQGDTPPPVDKHRPSEPEDDERQPTREPVAATSPEARAEPLTRSLASDGKVVTDGGQDPAVQRVDQPPPADQATRATARPEMIDRTPAAQASHVSHQIASAVRGHREGNVEISLSPEELGKVRMTLHPHDTGMRVVVQAERMETLDLMRRHIESLERDFREIGYADVSFTFSDHPRQQADASPFPPEPSSEDFSPTPATPVAAEPRRAAPTSSGGLDLRI